jgi:MGT family glycosyltransferase
MPKGLFFSLPSVSVSKTLAPIVNGVAMSGHEIVYYNMADFRPDGDFHFRFKPYPDNCNAYYTDKIDEQTSYFDFGNILLDSAASLMDFLVSEVEKEKPDFIIHSHLAVWGKLIALLSKIPAITFYTTFVLDKRIMLPFIRKLNAGNDVSFDHVSEAMSFYRKFSGLYERFQLNGKPDVWDVYINKEGLNISFILKSFQSQPGLFGKEFRFVGYPTPIEKTGLEKSVIYVSMGTIMKGDIPFYKMVIDVLKDFRLNCIISVGDRIGIGQLGEIPEHIQVVPFTDQREVLKGARLFLTRGGMASVHEAVYTYTPMIVIPVIPEQQLTACRIEELGIGKQIPLKEVNEQTLRQAIGQILNNYDSYVQNLEALVAQASPITPEKQAALAINEFLREKTIVDLFNEAAKENPNAIAVIHGNKSITYGRLYEKAKHLAHYLRSKGVKEEVCVPVFLEPGIDIIIAIMGILKAGGAYVPIDPEYPEERIAYVLQDVECKIVISNSSAATKLSGDIILMDEEWPEIDAPPLPLPSPAHLAYVIYTSGSTGKPKGVMVEHGQIYTYTLDIVERFYLNKCDSYAILGTFSADAGHTAVFGALCFGKRLNIVNIKDISGFQALAEQFEKYPVDCYKTTPTLLQFLLQNKEAHKILPLKRLIVGGEACPLTLANDVLKILPEGCMLFNHYGPTETTVGVVTYEFPRNIEEFPAMVPMGKPLQHVQAYILNELAEAAPGQTGELYIGGPLVARGYLKNPALTSQRFIQRQSDRLYKTGDIVKYLPDGNIQYLGRQDDQVKIHGNRIELKEIEHIVLQSGMVKQCVIVARENKYLIGYVMPENGFNKAELLAVLRKKLPGYMIPSKWMLVEKWPLTFNNKIDKNALPDPELEWQEPAGDDNSIEGKLKNIWRRLLGISSIDVSDHFFDIGGDSLQLIKLRFEISTHFQIELPAVDLFRHLTIRELAELLRNYSKPEDHLEGFNEKEVSVTQRNLFIQKMLNPWLAFPNSSITFEIQGEIDTVRLELAVKKIISLNESLKTAYSYVKGKVYKQVCEEVDFNIQCINTPATDIDQQIIALTKPFDFTKAPLLRIFVIGRKFLHIDLPHINSDGESLKIFMDDLEAIYNDKYIDNPKHQYTDFQKNAHAYLHSKQYKADQQFWEQQLAEDILPLQFNVKAKGSKFDGEYVVSCLPVNVNDYTRNKRLTRFQFLLAMYFLLLYKLTQANKFMVMLPVHNRNGKGMEEVFGLLSNVVLVKATINAGESINDFIARSREVILDAIRHQQFPFEKQLELWTKQGREASKLFSSFFGYHYNRGEYTFGEATLKLHIPVRNKENLPLSMAIFETGNHLILRLSSNGFSKAELTNLGQMYSDLIDLVVNTNGNESVGALLNLHEPAF